MASTRTSPRDLSYSPCAYCNYASLDGIAKCNECGLCFCNAPCEREGSHIFLHLHLSSHFRISLSHKNSFRQGKLSCETCHNNCIFALGLLPSREIICKDKCFDAYRLKSPTIRTELDLTSIIIERALQPSILPIPPEPIQISFAEVKAIERILSDREQFQIQEALEKLPNRFRDEEHYTSEHLKLIGVQRSYEVFKTDHKIITNISITWENDGKLGSFMTTATIWYRRDSFIQITVPNDGWEATARIKYKRLGRVYFSIKSGSRPAVRGKGPHEDPRAYTIQPLPNMILLDRQTQAIREFPNFDKFIKNCIIGKSRFTYDEATSLRLIGQLTGELSHLDELNDTQRKVVAQAVFGPLTLIQGPPGTGKTRVATNIIKCKLDLDPDVKILACAPSNIAVSNLAEKLSKLGVDVVHMVARSKTDKYVSDLTLASQADRSLTPKEKSPENRKTFKKNLRKAEAQVLKKARVVCCTCSVANDGRLGRKKFEFVLVDEATQSVEPETLCALTLGVKQLVLIGDQEQLGPTVRMNALKNIKFGRSLYERMINCNNHFTTLNYQYRMHPEIADFSNRKYYRNQLVSVCTARDRTEPQFTAIWENHPEKPMIFCHVEGPEEIGSTGSSYVNRFECVAVCDYLSQFRNLKLKADEIGVISFYSAQVDEIKRRLENKATEDNPWYRQVEVNSVDAFQGREKKYIILSCVRSNENLGVGFIADFRRLNVALTRAQYGLIIVGNYLRLMTSPIWGELINDYQRKGLLLLYS